MEEIILFLKCIADETRLKMLKLLLEQRLCVCELTEILEKSQPCISQHLRRFRELQLVIEEREEQWAYYSVNRAVYDSFLQKLNDFGSTCYSTLGLGDLQENLHKVKTINLCQMNRR